MQFYLRSRNSQRNDQIAINRTAFIARRLINEADQRLVYHGHWRTVKELNTDSMSIATRCCERIRRLHWNGSNFAAGRRTARTSQCNDARTGTMIGEQSPNGRRRTDSLARRRARCAPPSFPVRRARSRLFIQSRPDMRFCGPLSAAKPRRGHATRIDGAGSKMIAGLDIQGARRTRADAGRRRRALRVLRRRVRHRRRRDPGAGVLRMLPARRGAAGGADAALHRHFARRSSSRPRSARFARITSAARSIWTSSSVWWLPIVIGVIAGSVTARYAPERLFKIVFVMVAWSAAARLLLARDSWKLGDDDPDRTPDAALWLLSSGCSRR